jgi:hypothetical protein
MLSAAVLKNRTARRKPFHGFRPLLQSEEAEAGGLPEIRFCRSSLVK